MRSLLCAVAIGIMAAVSACRVSQQPDAVPEAVAAPSAQKVADTSTCDATVAPPGAMFPSNFDYPQSEATIQSWVQTRDGDRQRLHAYCVFAGLNYWWTPSTPTWRAWQTTTQAFPYQYNPWPSEAGGKAASGLPVERAVPINIARSRAVGATGEIVNPAPTYYVNAAVANNPVYQSNGCLQAATDENGNVLGYTLRDGKTFQSNGDIMVAAVSYSPFALQQILGRNLYNASVLDSQLPAQASSSSTTISEFHPYSVVLKVMLWPVSGTGPTALPIWDWDANKPGSSSDGQYAGYEMQKFWTNAVAVSSSTSPTANVTFLYGVLDSSGKSALGPNTYQNAQVVGLDRFYSTTYSDTDLAALSPCDQAILDASAWWTYERGFQAGDSLAMIAMHIMTKEQSDWTFQSAWWHPDALDCTTNSRFCGDRPTSVPGGDTTWKNYMMTTTYGQQQKAGQSNYYAPPDTRQPPQIWPVAYNPYIELAASHPITTNCMNCHHRAAWPPNSELFPTKKDQGRFSAYLQASTPNPNVLEVFESSNSAFNGLLMLDSMWAVSDRAGYATTQTQAGTSGGAADTKPR